MAETILLIDGMYLTYSSFYSNRGMRTLKGEPTGAVYGFVIRMEGLIRELKPDRVAVAFDSREKNFRHRLFPEYKAKRQPPPEELLDQLPAIKEYIQARGITQFECPGFEADDIIAHIARRHARENQEVIIFSADKDLFQLIDPRVFVFHPKLKQKLNREEVKDFFGVYPEQIVDYLSLVGDVSDNIPGIPGVGEKTALKLIQRFGNVKTLLEKLDELDEKTRRKISDHLSLFAKSRKLLDLALVPEIPDTLEIPGFADRQTGALADLYRRLSFDSLLKKMEAPPADGDRALPIQARVIRDLGELKALKTELQGQKVIGLDVETTAIEFFRSEIVGVSLSFGDKGYYVPLLFPESEKKIISLSAADFISQMGDVLENSRIRKTGHNLKFDVLHLRNLGIGVEGIGDDTMVMFYLLFPNRRSHGLKELTSEFLQYRQTGYADLVGKGKGQIALRDVELDKISRYCIEDSWLSLRLADALQGRLDEKGLRSLYEEIEIPLIQVLESMEHEGVKVDQDFLHRASQVLQEKIVAIEKEIYAMAGFEFNLNSSQQLGELLFVKMGLPLNKKTRKTKAYSTDIDVLNELKGYPVVEKIIDYRTYRKLLSTYIEGLLESTDSAGRIHTSFNQTVTATGRLSSSNPNLQNIPVGEMGGVEIRRAFVAEKGKFLLAADYSQIELRVMAHFSEDQNLFEAFRRNLDIHQHTADLVFGPDSRGKEQRRRAKIINFSIIYGTGPFSLSKELGVPFAEAKAFIDKYFETYSGVKRFIDKVVADAEAFPEVRTISGRIRQIPEIQSSNRAVKENGNRMAINTVVQGSAADIIKIAMIGIHRHLRSMKSRLLMQVHDELIFEYPPEEEKRLFALVKKEMETAVALRVPLKVKLERGVNWAELEEV